MLASIPSLSYLPSPGILRHCGVAVPSMRQAFYSTPSQSLIFLYLISPLSHEPSNLSSQDFGGKATKFGNE